VDPYDFSKIEINEEEFEEMLAMTGTTVTSTLVKQASSSMGKREIFDSVGALSR
jgi:hypothetical protein